MRALMITGTAAALALTGAGLAAASQADGSPRLAPAILTLATVPGPAAADSAAAAYIQGRHPGPGTTRVLATEPDTDRGTAVYDVRILAPDAVVYVVHVQRGTGTVLWANTAEDQGTGQAGPAGGTGSSPDSRDAPDRSPASAPRSPDHQDRPDTGSSQYDD